MRRVLVAAIVLVAVLSCAAVARPATTFVVKGHGWGHGIGLAQYGAQGYAADGQTYDWILDHYYPGTTLAERSAKRRVLLASSRSALSFGSAAAFKANGVAQPFSAGTWTVTANGDGRLRLAKDGVVRRVASPKTFDAGDMPLVVSGVRYRGTITLRLKGAGVWALNTLGLEAYVRGVVPREMPSSWHLEALKAQAVAARSYSLAGQGKCDWFGTQALCPTTSDQVYGGRSAETTSTNTAVTETAHKVLLFGSQVAATFFFSSSGGRTASVTDVWGSPQASYPYLVSVPDPHDDISPHHYWGPGDLEEDCLDGGRDCVWSAPALTQALGGLAQGRVRDFRVTARNGSRRVAEARIDGSGGVTVLDSLAEVGNLRVVLGLRSNWFTIGVLRLTGAGTVTSGQRRTLHALARHLSGAKLQKKVGAGAWTTMREIDGSVDVRVRPGATTLYRLKSPTASTAPVRVTVAAQPRFAVAQTAYALAGVAAPGEVVQVQRQREDGDWTTVGIALARQDGAWRASLRVAPGVYRAYVASGGVVGTSPSLTVVAG